MNRRLGWIFSLFAIGAAAWLADSRLTTPVDAATKANGAAHATRLCGSH